MLASDIYSKKKACCALADQQKAFDKVEIIELWVILKKPVVNVCIDK